MAFPGWLRRVWTGAEVAHTAAWLYGILGMAAIMAYLASITDWINAYGPLAWVVLVLLLSLLWRSAFIFMGYINPKVCMRIT